MSSGYADAVFLDLWARLSSMRFEGVIKSWNDERGFGFIEARQGGQEIFVHIKAFSGLRGRPQPAQRVTFEVELGSQGKKRALKVEMAPVPRKVATPNQQNHSTPSGVVNWLMLLALPMVLGLGYVLGEPPRWALWLYPVASVLTFMVYALDKSAAKRGAWRTRESTLHLLALTGGWPGALVAQQVLRHKSSKAEFRVIFWATVLLNLAAFSFLVSPYGAVKMLL